MKGFDHAGHAHGAARAALPAHLEATCPLECEALPAVQPGPLLEEAGRRSAAIRRVFIVTLVLNLVVAAAKGVYGYVSGSVSVTADAFHSLLDAASNVLALVGMHFAVSPADAGHPYGHRKFEVLASLGIGVVIAVSLTEIGGAALTALAGKRPPPDIGWPGFAVVLGTMAVNTFVTRFESRWGRRLESPLLVADAHHTRSDVYASTTVLVSFAGAKLGLWWADGVCGLLVVIMVGRVAWDVFRENIPSLVDAAVLDPTQVRMLAAGLGPCGVRNIHAVRSRGTKWAAELDLHLAVDPGMRVEDAHALAHRVEDALRAGMPHIKDVVVHVEPATEIENEVKS